jgi:hypothetical protein
MRATLRRLASSFGDIGIAWLVRGAGEKSSGGPIGTTVGTKRGLPAITPSIPHGFFAALGVENHDVKFSYLHGEEIT